MSNILHSQDLSDNILHFLPIDCATLVSIEAFEDVLSDLLGLGLLVPGLSTNVSVEFVLRFILFEVSRQLIPLLSQMPWQVIINIVEELINTRLRSI